MCNGKSKIKGKVCNAIIKSGPNSKWPNVGAHSMESIDRNLSERSRHSFFHVHQQRGQASFCQECDHSQEE